MLSVVRSLAIGIATFVVVARVAYEIAFQLSPPRTASGHPTMPIGHAVIAFLVGGVTALIVIAVDHSRRARRRAADIERIARDPDADVRL